MTVKISCGDLCSPETVKKVNPKSCQSATINPKAFPRVTIMATPIFAPAAPSILRGARKEELVYKLLSAKKASGKTFTQIAKEVGVTNLYTAQLFHNQTELKPGSAAALQAAVPGLTDELVEEMKVSPLRQFDPSIIQEPTVYRLYEAIMLYGESIKAIANEEFGDGIMSAIDMFATVDDVVGSAGEKRMVITLNGKFLPHIEQKTENITARSPKPE
ncbi:g9830 [Coccomyxa elongata]